MASLYPKAKSPFWWIQFIEGGKRKNQSTGLRRDNPVETAQAHVLLAQWREREAVGKDGESGEAGWDFVGDFLAQNAGRNPSTLRRYETAWHWIALFLGQNELRSPRDVRFRHAAEFVEFRTNWKKKSGRQVGRNTAILDLKVFSQLMQRAVQLEIIQGNPLVKTGLKREKARKKPEITKQEFDEIERALEDEPEWMQTSFAIARHTGCRLSETVIPLRNIDFDSGVIHFENPKGGEERAFSVPLPAALRPVLERLRGLGRRVTLELPFQPSRKWGQFFARLGLPHLCFHCLRVSYVTALARTGAPRAVAMRLVNHSSELVHRVYQRLDVDDLRAWIDLSAPERAPALPGPSARPRSRSDRSGRK